MKAKNIIIFLIILAVAGGGFYLFQKKKQSKDLEIHNKEKFLRITKLAKEENAAGLLIMASAINHFHKLNGSYPDQLIKLYPQFIPDKPFITSIPWKYYPQKGTYLLKKSVQGERYFASMGPDFRLKSGKDSLSTKDDLIASANKPELQKKSEKQSSVQKSSKTKPDTPQEKLATSSTGTIKKAPETTKKEEAPIQIVEKELSKDEKFLLSFDGNRLYIWKTKDGFIGFSNIQYPEEKNLTIYRAQRWIEYNHRQNSDKKNSVTNN